MLGLRLRVHDVLRFSTKNSTNDRIISIFRRCSRAICRSPDSLQEMAGHRHPPVLRIAKYPGDWERGSDHSPLRRLQLLFRVVDEDFPARSALLAPRGNEEF